MERFRRRKSRNRAATEGCKQTQKLKTSPNLTGGCVSCGRPITVGNSYCEEEVDATDQVTVTPMKKLLAKEMSKESESKRQSPSIIARLMGLDGLPAQPIHRHRKAMPDDFELRKKAQIFGQSSRNSSMEQQSFKDVYVYEDLEMEILKEKYMKKEANDHFTDEWFQQNDSSPYVKHLPDLECTPSTSRISQRKRGDSLLRHSYNDHSAHISKRNHGDSILRHSYNDRSAHISSNAQFLSRYEIQNDILPAQIVVLKPNIGKMCHSSATGTSLLSPYSYHECLSDYTRRLEYSSSRGTYYSSSEVGSMQHIGYSSARGKNLFTNDVGSSSHRAKEVKDFAKKISRRMRDENISHPKGGYVADESSYSDNSGGEFENSVAWSNRDSSRSRSGTPFAGCRSYERSGKHDSFSGERLMPKEAGSEDNAKKIKGSLRKKENYSDNKIIRSSGRILDPICQRDDYKELKVSPTASCVSVSNSENDSIQASSIASDEDLASLPMYKWRSHKSAASGQEPSIGPPTVEEWPKPEPESLLTSKESDQPSPVSVLEPPSSVDVSYGSDCFERISADLHELRLKCQLLKMESNTYPEEFDKENGTSLTFAPSKEAFSSENWESLYLSAVLAESGISLNYPSTFTSTWSCQDYPLATHAFDDLEKYCDESHVPKPERKLLFDRINLGLSEIFNGLVDPWLGSICGSKVNRGVKDELERVLAKQVEESNVEFSVNVLDREMNWLGVQGEFSVIGMDLEKLLVDDLIMEVLGYDGCYR